MKHTDSSLRVFILLTGLLLGPPSWAACAYATIPNPHPDGIGKSYCERQISKVMGWQGAPWLERPQRLQEERTDLLIQKLNLKPGMVVGDIGAGTGHIAQMMAEKIGPNGVAWVVDIQPQMIKMLQKKAEGLPKGRMQIRQSSEKNLNLPDRILDVAIMVDVYHELEYPRETLQSLMKAVKKGGKIVFVEYRAFDPDVPIKPLHTMSVAQVQKEAEDLGLKYEKAESLSWQNMITFINP
ncbi:class I SAM-dependent methyltransferase [Limnobacter sp.]|jgi:ubiquinone/menaquinone biosynthesis C-methylase UbiE|uniref:class I SAM-dependent methyltransferase n=1 Tax=Limnobacter sp. TaxID=2003368 RepID=UPI00273763C8|nr:methyltransferase domain-containing protein [Limnobacter sp.]MDP3272772.1 methyltransferase domain-containing protein [Limnobacter sp.]